ncbi:hypothetical protein [Ruminococcus albus]|uniref:hypothetical protein n=1 Tax=Ruminococcus albus TaxID=1264 RepID=UPI0004ACB233|nr:hypothetical protein [Ruminococcus albus]
MKSAGILFKGREIITSALEGSLSANEVPVEVYHNLIKAVHDNMNYMYDYVALRKKASRC